MMARDAVSTIRGYFYQFDYSIIKILKLEHDTDTITIEGIEDVDINDESNIALHQCKCYEGTEYNHSEIKDAVQWMLKHYAENKNGNYKYYIYGVYKSGQQKLPIDFDVEFAKKHFLITKHRNAPDEILYKNLNLTDNDLSDFLQKLNININAQHYEVQERALRDELCSALGCKKQEVEQYYCTALSIIKKLSTNKNVQKRTISRREFIRQIRETDDQFEAWLLHKNGQNRFARAIKKKYFSNGFNLSPYERFFIIECDKNISIVDLKTLVLHISKQYSKLSPRSKPKFCPYLCFYGLDDKKLVELKKAFARDRVLFKDGYNFRGADFDVLSIIQEPNANNLVKFRIVDNICFLDEIYEAVTSTIEIYQFYCTSVFYTNTKYKHVRIPFENINDIVDMT